MLLPFTYVADNSDNAPSNQTTSENPSWTKLTFVTFYMILPVAGLALLWGRKDLLTKFLLQIDRNCVSVFCPSFSRRQKLLNWASHQLPSTSQQTKTLSNGIGELWQDGSLLCTIINTVVPGACPNPYRHWQKPPIHAQALAYKYFELPPLFAEKELSDALTIHQEHKFMHYLHELQQAINKWPSTKDFDVVDHSKFSSQYVARGMGLYTGEQYRKTVFYIYTKKLPTTTTTKSDIFMYIRGPYGTKGRAVIPTNNKLATIPTINELQQRLKRNKRLTMNGDHDVAKKANRLLRNISLDFKSFINSNNIDNNNNNRDLNDIQIQIEHESDRTKIVYIPNNYGIYEINLIINGELFKGSPFHININKNTSGIRDSFNQNTNNDHNKITITKRRILSKTIDCIDEKLVIDHDSKVEKIPKKTQLSEIKEIDTDMDCVRLDTPDSSICTQDSGIDEQIKINNDGMAVEVTTQNLDPISKQEITNKIYLEINPLDTSPICCDHIETEVVPVGDGDVPNQRSNLSEKRRRFCKQNSVNYSSTPTNSSFSTSIENDDCSNNSNKTSTDVFEELSVMNVLETIKQSAKNPLFNAISLPDMTDLCHYENLFKAKRDYWEKLSSSCSSSTASLIHVDVNQQRQRIHRKHIFINNGDNKEATKQFCKSTHNFNSFNFDNNSNISLEDTKKLHSADNPLDDYRILTIEQRKKNLLKDQYEKEVLCRPKKLLVEEQKFVEPTENIVVQDQCLPITERIRKFDNRVVHQSSPKMDEIKQTSIERFKSPFRRAVNYFRNLEEAATIKLNKMQNNNRNNTHKRRYSLDETCNNDNNNNKRQSGSLNLPKVSQRFSINNLYEDVIGGEFSSRRNSFKGTPNKNAVINSLASLNNNEILLKRNNEYLQQDESNVENNLFINKGKTKTRRSIRNLFDVNY